jgi:dethiobiotin synthetase
MILFVTGIDTGIGKTVAVGLMARWYAARGFAVVTQKLVQTGCEGFPEDILAHRQLMGTDLFPEDRRGLTCPYVFRFPGSPHLAAALEGKRIDTGRLEAAARELAARYEVVLVEGVGGLCVPLTARTTVLDFVARQRWPVILVTAPRLGSINHTLLALEALRSRALPLAAVLYNLRFTALPEIVNDTRRVIEDALRVMGYDAPVLDLPAMDADPPVAGFDGLPTPTHATRAERLPE